MTNSNILARRTFCLALLCLTALGSASGQQKQSPRNQKDDVVRISTELVQTIVMVFDKQGRFVEGLKPEQFELRVDDQAVQLSSFERVAAGTESEEQFIATSSRDRGNQAATAATSISEGAVFRGRTVVFFVDDLHLSSSSMDRTRKAILEFVDNQMGPSDQVAIASASGQVGFLQQFTDLPSVLRAAISRLNYRPYTVRDSENIPMTEYTALQIEQGDKFALEYYSTELLKATNYNAGGGLGPPRSAPYGGRPVAGQTPGITRDVAERLVKARAEMMLKQSAAVTTSTLTTLESLMRTSGQMPGRKLVFFISDGFYLNDRNTGLGDKLRQITDAATRSGVVIYAMDARGLVSMTDAASNRADPAGLSSRADVGEIAVSQDALSMLAAETGGRAQLNTQRLTAFTKEALSETSNYYLLAWRPAVEEQKGGKFKRLEVKIAGRPDLTVRLPRGFFVGEANAAQKNADASPNAVEHTTQPAAAKGLDADLKAALTAYAPKRGLHTQVSVSFVDVPGSGPVLTTSTQIATGALGYGPEGKQPAAVDLAGVILNDQGKPAGSFKTRLNVNPLAEGMAANNPSVIYSSKVPLKPGIYQVRVAARDDRSGRVGSATRWIEIPDLSSRRLTLSSLLLGGQFVGSNQKQSNGGTASEQIQFSVDRRFLHGSHLNVLTIIYNAARAAGGNNAPQLEAQIRISKGGQTIVTSPLRKLSVDPAADLARIPYGADIALRTLPAGRYLLEVTVNDRVAQSSASQLITFDIEPVAKEQK